MTPSTSLRIVTALSTALGLQAGHAAWDGFDFVLSLNSGLSNAAFEIDFQYTPHYHVGGVAAGDVNGDGHADVVLVRGDNSPRLYLSDGDGTYTERTQAAGLADITAPSDIVNGLMLADINGDGYLDLLMGGVSHADIPEGPHTPIRMLLNDGAGHFTDHTLASNVSSPRTSIDVPLGSNSMSLGDVDRDGHTDLMITYWHQGEGSASGHLWRNTGGGVFVDISQSSDIGAFYAADDSLFNFTPSFTDLNDDGWPDLVVSADFENSRVFRNDGDGTFTETTQRGLAGETDVITDENGMGAAVGDFDNDGDFDWFVTSIWEDTDDPCLRENGEPCYGVTGNRLYLNDGSGQFTDATDIAGVREGDWGWGACAADFDNDGWLDILMVNGYQIHAPRFTGNRARLFMNDGDGTFTERSSEFGLNSSGQGRALVCFDSDNDGWIDVLVQNSQPQGENAVQPHFFRNRAGAAHHWLTLRLEGPPPNRNAIGAKITLQAGGLTQVREIRAGGTYLSSAPPEAHFGLGANDTVDLLEVRWPNGQVTTWTDLETDQIMELDYDSLYADRFD